jgi:hypothetical protein
VARQYYITNSQGHRFVQILCKIQFITNKIDDCQLGQKIGLFISWVLQKSLKPNASEVKDCLTTSKSS